MRVDSLLFLCSPKGEHTVAACPSYQSFSPSSPPSICLSVHWKPFLHNLQTKLDRTSYRNSLGYNVIFHAHHFEAQSWKKGFSCKIPVFVAFVEDHASVSSIWYFENRVS